MTDEPLVSADGQQFDYETRHRHLEQKVQELSANPHLPGDLVALVAEVARLQLDVEREARFQLPSRLTCAEAHAQGAPLHPREDFRPDLAQASELLERILAVACDVPGPLGRAAGAFRSGHWAEFRLDQAALAYALGNEDWFRTWEAMTPEAPRLAAFLTRSALAPALAAEACSLRGRLSEKAWRHGHCPICGSLPLISSLRGTAGERWVVCSHCATEYRVPRLRCVFCGESDPERLAFYDLPGEPGYRIDTCDTCGLYLKTSDFRALDRISVPMLDDLESLTMDLAAASRHYRRPTVSGWGF